MRYFILQQDINLENTIKLDGFNNVEKMILLKEDHNKLKNTTSVPVSGNVNSIYPDIVEAPALMVSDELHKIFKWYENTIIYKAAVFSDLKMERQDVYRLVLPDVIEALSEKTTYFKNGWVDKIVLDKKKIGDYNIFRIKAGNDYYFIVSLDVVESILKRSFMGIKFKEVEVV